MDWRKLDPGNRAEPRHSSQGNGGEHRERAKTQTKGDVRAAPKASLRPETPIFAAAGLSLASSLAHLWEAPGHFVLWWGYGASFLAVALVQGLLGLAILRWSANQPLLFVGVVATIAVVVLRVATYTSGVPFFGPHAGQLEDLGPLDVGATTASVVVIAALAGLLSGAYRRVAMNTLVVLGAGIWALRFLGFL
jgi:hypothetical protein